MEKKETAEIEISDEIGRFAESYSSFNKIINKVQRQYLTLKETYLAQSRELQDVNRTLQSLVAENRAVTEFLNSILNSLASGVIAVDNAGRVTHINPAARRLLAIPEDRQCRDGLEYVDIVRNVDADAASALSTAADGRLFNGVEKKVETFNGTVLTLSVSTSLLQRVGGEVVGAVELFYDISKMKRLEEQLSRMKVLASLGELAASIAHEVRNPLVGISGFASLLARDLEGDPHKKEMAEKIVTGVNSINQTIQNLLDFARHEKVRKSTVELPGYLNLVLDNFIETAAFSSGGGPVIGRYLNGESKITVDLDRQLFRQAIFNILANGIEAGGDRAELSVGCELIPVRQAHDEYGDRLELSGTEAVALIDIGDSGPGIHEDDLEKIFSPFYSTKENGNGLGLAIAWKIVKAHGGDISAESKIGEGTRFRLILPARPTQ